MSLLMNSINEPWYGEDAINEAYNGYSTHYIVKDIAFKYSGSDEIQFNKAVILKMFENGDVEAVLYFVENGRAIRWDEDIIITDGTIEFTDEERAKLLPSEPTLTLDDYKAEKLAKLYAYDKSEEVNSFTIQGVKMWLDNDTRRKLKFRIDAEKASLKETTTLCFNGIAFTFPIDIALDMINKLEVYASECYDRTQEIERNVRALESKEAVHDYPFDGYPKMLEL